MIVILVEERSMEAALKGLLPNLGVADEHVRIIPHEGVKDLERSLPRKLRAWRDPSARFLVLRDNDGKDCRALKDGLTQACTQNGRASRSKVRIVCQELEAWFLGDLDALEKSGLVDGRAADRIPRQARYRDPDGINKPSEEIRRLVQGYSKVGTAMTIGPHLDPQCNRSASFIALVNAVHELRDMS